MDRLTLSAPLTAACITLCSSLTAAGALVSDYRFDDGTQVSGTSATAVVDSVASGANGDLRYNGDFYNFATPQSGGPSFVDSGAGASADFLAGSHGTALSMAATGGGEVAFGRISDHDFARADFTIAGWFRKADAAGQRILYDNAVHNFGGQLLHIDASGKLVFEVKGGPGGSDPVLPGDNLAIASDAAVTDGAWHSFVALVSGETASLFIDGSAQVATAAYGVNTKATPTGSKGTRMAVEFGGELDTLQIYSHAFSPSDINSFAGVPEPASAALLAVSTGLLAQRRRRPR